MSQIYSASLVAILAQVLPHVGVTIGNEELTTTISTIVTVLAGLWAMYRRYKQGDITVSGRRRA